MIDATDGEGTSRPKRDKHFRNDILNWIINFYLNSEGVPMSTVKPFEARYTRVGGKNWNHPFENAMLSYFREMYPGGAKTLKDFFFTVLKRLLKERIIKKKLL